MRQSHAVSDSAAVPAVATVVKCMESMENQPVVLGPPTSLRLEDGIAKRLPLLSPASLFLEGLL